MIVAVQPADVLAWWPQAREFVARVPQTGYSPLDILHDLTAGRNQLWVVLDEAGEVCAALVTEIQQYPRERVCVGFVCGGDGARRWTGELERAVAAWAGQHQCAAMEIYGRPGWQRVLRGWEQTHVILRKTLGEAADGQQAEAADS